jgi:carbamoylphosphate synthase large subunit
MPLGKFAGAPASQRRDAILFALENRFSLSRIPLMLHRAGCRVTLLGNPQSAVAASRFVHRMLPCPIDPPSAAKTLRKVMESHPGPLPWVVFGDELALQAGLLCKDQPWLKGVFPVDPSGPADAIFRKAAFMKAAQSAGIPIPAMRVCNSRSEATAAAAQLQFPLFFKRDLDCAGAGITQVNDPADVELAFENLSDTGAVVVQQKIHGRVGKTNTLYSHGRLMCHTSAYARKTWPGPHGPSCVREYFCHDELEKIAAAIGAMTGFHGLCGFDWIQDRETGRFLVIEFNGRPIATYHLAKYVGVHYAPAIRDFLAGRLTVQRPRMITSTRPVVHMFPQDVRRCITDWDFIGMAKWLVGDIITDTPWSDPNLVMFCYKSWAQLGYKRVRRLIRRRSRRTPFAPSPLGQPDSRETETSHAMA